MPPVGPPLDLFKNGWEEEALREGEEEMVEEREGEGVIMGEGEEEEMVFEREGEEEEEEGGEGEGKNPEPRLGGGGPPDRGGGRGGGSFFILERGEGYVGEGEGRRGDGEVEGGGVEGVFPGFDWEKQRGLIGRENTTNFVKKNKHFLLICFGVD